MTILHYFLQSNGDFCPSVFDGYLCWPKTQLENWATLPCPAISGYENFENLTASKQCMSSGEWYKNYDNTEWTNYSLCIDHQYAETIKIESTEFSNDSSNSSLSQVS
ncbi:hypothetical protein HCN44_002541 [Aphidius gifuensis]|uniref:G-protein coupled receptors family 2 profile 1 domain-containing protein n=1 Tax=Aphidius gifuensis TaxID=684658 RepID=A0A834Y2N6_APHGI|nr:hypothetical protein HCN44_002541 [Aphidius gifuensis]